MRSACSASTFGSFPISKTGSDAISSLLRSAPATPTSPNDDEEAGAKQDLCVLGVDRLHWCGSREGVPAACHSASILRAHAADEAEPEWCSDDGGRCVIGRHKPRPARSHA